MEKIKIRKAYAKDFDEFYRMRKDFVEVMRSFYRKNERSNWRKVDLDFLMNDVRKKIRSRKNIFIVAESDNQIIGYAVGSVGLKDPRGESYGEIDEIFVKKIFRGGFVGKTLLDHLIKIMKRRGTKRLKHQYQLEMNAQRNFLRSSDSMNILQYSSENGKW
jgi:ribosomal protein S18 acetylase RimI-like enzyme